MNELRIMEIIAAMKSNNGTHQQWIKELEEALGIYPITIDYE